MENAENVLTDSFHLYLELHATTKLRYAYGRCEDIRFNHTYAACAACGSATLLLMFMHGQTARAIAKFVFLSDSCKRRKK